MIYVIQTGGKGRYTSSIDYIKFLTFENIGLAQKYIDENTRSELDFKYWAHFEIVTNGDTFEPGSE